MINIYESQSVWSAKIRKPKLASHCWINMVEGLGVVPWEKSKQINKHMIPWASCVDATSSTRVSSWLVRPSWLIPSSSVSLLWERIQKKYIMKCISHCVKPASKLNSLRAVTFKTCEYSLAGDPQQYNWWTPFKIYTPWKILEKRTTVHYASWFCNSKWSWHTLQMFAKHYNPRHTIPWNTIKQGLL